MQLDTKRWLFRPFSHQIDGVKKLLEHSSFALFDEPGAGKSKQVIDAACTLAYAEKINTAVVVCPASVRTVWCNEEIGEIKKHSWIQSRVMEFALGKFKTKWRSDDWHEGRGLHWVVTNYEILRSAKHLQVLLDTIRNNSTMLVLDEASYIKSRTAKQTKAIMRLRGACSRCVILNGTPITHSPLDLFSQMGVLSPKILGDNFYVFRSKYCEIHRKRFGSAPAFDQITGYKNLDDLTKRCAPYVLRRLKSDCLDLPPKLFTVREVALTEESWKRYTELKKEAMLTLSVDDVRVEPNAAVRIMRLAQLTSGHLGSTTPKHTAYNAQSGFPIEIDKEYDPINDKFITTETDDLSSEKLDWCVQYLTEECTARYVIVWCRWRRERERLVALLEKKRDMLIYQIYGGQKDSDRQLAIESFTRPGLSLNIDDGKITTVEKDVLIAQVQAGGLGLNLVNATEVIYLSNDWSYGMRLQSEDRCHRPGQVHPVSYIDVLATGPKGQRTVDHAVFKALREKQELANWTTGRWRKELDESF